MSETARPRVLFVDVLRLLALLQMVNGHTLHALLSQDVRHGSIYAGYLWFRGLVSVAFMLAAGLSFYLTTLSRPEARAGSARRHRIGRALEIIALGFLLRLPVGAILSGDGQAIARGFAGLAQIDVLPCIGVSLLILELIQGRFPHVRDVVAACALLTLAAAGLSAWGASLPSALPWGFLSGWLGPQGGSAFPLLPYAGYVFAGVAVGAFTLPLGAATPARVAAGRLAAAGLACWVASLALERLPFGFWASARPGVHTPGFFALKLAVVISACAVLALGLRKLRALPRPLAALGGETLAIYVFHLFVLYGAPLALARRIGPRLGLWHAVSFSLLMLASSAVFGLAWQRFKQLRQARERWPKLRARAIALSSAWLLVCAFPPAARGGERDPLESAEVLRVSLPVPDLAAAESFLAGTLGFTRLGEPVDWAGPEYAGLVGLPGARAKSQRLQLGREQIELVAFEPPHGRAIPQGSRSHDLWFQHLALVTSDLDRASAGVLEAGARAISRGPQQIPATNRAAGGIRAFYFEGPAAHPLELIWYPLGKGQPRWQAGRARMLGIDHSAIAVADSGRSRRFYQALGLSVAGESFNFGPEQEALSGVDGARVHITGLRGRGGPGVELLQYEAPRDGRPAPPDTQANDIWRDEIVVRVRDVERAQLRLKALGARAVSDRVHALPRLGAAGDGTLRAITLLDPDGHAVRIVGG